VKHGALGALVAVGFAVAQVPPATVIDYPEEGSIFPPDIAAPTFLWRDARAGISTWQIDIAFADGAPPIRRTVRGEPMHVGPIDPRTVAPTNELPQLTRQQSEEHTWKPDASAWAEIERHHSPLTITVSGGPAGTPSRVHISISKDPVGAPIFYRDVPLMPAELQKGVIKPIVPAAIPLIGWRLRNVSDSESRLLMEGLPTCANCHSFSRDGKWLAMDVDGPQNDKGMYAIAAIAPQMGIRTEDVFSWNDFPDKPPGTRTIGFMAQVSPDGAYAVTTVNEDVFVANFKDYRFLQVFYPTRGILAWYNRSTRRIHALPGADNPAFVQTNGVWTPDGKDLIFARAAARDAYPAGGKMAQYAGDPLEPRIQYDLYRVPFNGGKGGRPKIIRGASRNGMSNSFPKVSPDGRWLVWVEAHNGQLMRPDGQLYIAPAEGGPARRMRCNTALMNSWHSFSPNSRWMVFSSKSRTPYTQMFLTHIDENGNDSPAILIENSTAANRAVNIPEFVNIPADGLQHIDVPAAEFYRLFDSAWELAEKGDYDRSIVEWDKALALSPDDAKAHNNLGRALAGRGDADQAMVHWQKAVELDPHYWEARNNLGVGLGSRGKVNEAITQFQLALAANPDSAAVHRNLARALAVKGKSDEAIAHWRKAIELAPESPEPYNDLGSELLRRGRFEESLTLWQKAVEVSPAFVPAYFNIGSTLAARGKPKPALAAWRKALAANPNDVPVLKHVAWLLATCPDASVRSGAEAIDLAQRAIRNAPASDPSLLDTLAAAYAEAGRFPEAHATASRALEGATAASNTDLSGAIKGRITLYENQTPFREGVPR
jgi:tetratricopeptide (TPR) repeat protein